MCVFAYAMVSSNIVHVMEKETVHHSLTHSYTRAHSLIHIATVCCPPSAVPGVARGSGPKAVLVIDFGFYIQIKKFQSWSKLWMSSRKLRCSLAHTHRYGRHGKMVVARRAIDDGTETRMFRGKL